MIPENDIPNVININGFEYVRRRLERVECAQCEKYLQEIAQYKKQVAEQRNTLWLLDDAKKDLIRRTNDRNAAIRIIANDLLKLI